MVSIILIVQLFQLPAERQILNNQILQESISLEAEMMMNTMRIEELELTEGNEEEIDQLSEENRRTSEVNQVIRSRLEALSSGSNEAYLLTTMNYYEINHDYEQYLEEVLDDSRVTEQADYQYYQLLYEMEEPFELRDSSLNTPHFIALTAEFLINPVVLSLLVIVSSLILINEVENHSFQFNLAEQVSKRKWIYAHQAVAFSLFIIGIVFSLGISRLLIHPFQDNFVEGASLEGSMSSPFIFLSEGETISIASFIGVVLLSVILLYPFLMQLFECILIYMKNPIFSGILYLVIVLGIAFYSESHYDPNRWWNPFQLLYLKDHLVKVTTKHISLLIVSTMGYTALIQYGLLKRLEKKPL
ncbi:hypothetical protein ACS127_15625 [Amphibacillus sp. Q70]|uniref:hypothetical protein n=1 Tax=Amphibacillus sp. Q70 TaxID=3453416 RepID=UPI003F82E041